MSDEENIFDLRKVGKKHNDASFEVSSKEKEVDMEKLLKNYKEVEQSQWHNLPRGTHIRYLRKDGQFKPGGYIFSIDVKVENEKQQIYLALAWSKNARFAKFAINLDTIERIWQSTNPIVNLPSQTSETTIDTLVSQVKTIQDNLQRLTKIVASLEKKIGR